MLGNATCAPDGTLFMEMAAIPPEKMDYTLYSLSDGTKDVRYAVAMVPGYKSVGFGFQYFASDYGVVTVVGATPQKNPMEESQDAAPQNVNLALIFDRKGTLQRAVPIPQNIDARSIGMYSSGDLLVVSKDAAANRLHLLVLDRDGDVKSELSLFDYDYEANRKSGKGQPLAKLLDQTDFVHILPHGDNLLLVPQGTAATIIEVNEQGIVRATDLALPPGYLIRSLISSDGPYWTVSSYGDAKIVHDKASGQSNATFHTGPLFQFNSFDGSLVRRINMPENLKANILCAHGGEFIAVTTDRKTGRLEMLTGSVPR